MSRSRASRARTSASMALPVPPGGASDAAAGTGTKAQCGSYSAPCSIQRTSSRRSSADSVRCDSGGGIISSGSSWWIRSTSALFAGSPGLITNQPSSRARWAPSGVSSRILALRAFSSGPWQRKQRSDSSGRIWWLKLTRSPAARPDGGGPVRAGAVGACAAGRPTTATASDSAARAAPAQDFRGNTGGLRAGRSYASSFVTTSPWTSVRRKSRPWKRYVSFVWSKPSRCRIVACRSWTWTWSSTALKPSSSVVAERQPRFTPPPASHIVNAFGWWSRPSLPPWTIGVRPNSPPQITSVSSSSPRCFRSLTSAALAWSVLLALLLQAADQVAVVVPASWKSCTNRTPRSTSRRASRQLLAKRRLARLGAVHVERLLRLLREVHQLRRARLHPVGHLVRVDARRDLRVADRVRAASRSACGSRRASRAASSASTPAGVREVQHRVALAAERHALVDGRQEAAAPVRRRRRSVPFWPVLKTTKPGRSCDFAAEAVGRPRAHARPAELLRAGVHEDLRRARG